MVPHLILFVGLAIAAVGCNRSGLLIPDEVYEGGVEVSVVTHWKGGKADAQYGITIYEQRTGWYQFGITASGVFAVTRLGPSIAQRRFERTLLAGPAFSEAIRRRGTNRLTARVVDGRLEFLVGGEKLVDTTDSVYVSGRIGVFQEGLQEKQRQRVKFSDLVVVSPVIQRG